MAKFKIEALTAKGKTWKAVGINPVTGKKMTFHGGQKGVRVGKKILKAKSHLMQGMMPPA